MSKGLKSTRAERQVRNQARGLLLVSVLLLIACASMTGTFGWSLGVDIFSKLLCAGGLVGADLGGAYLMSTAGTCWANNERGPARWAAFAAIVCCGLTFAGVIGFQGQNREGVVQARERAIKLGESQIEWYKSLTAENTQARGKSGTPNTGAMALGIEGRGKGRQRATRAASVGRGALNR